MTDIPIIFSAPMVLALLDGRKTMTRRLALRENGKPSPWQKVKPGDRLYVRESFAMTGGLGVRYAATDNIHELRKKRPSIHMPRWASRLTLAVTAVKIERLQAMSPADAIAEGMKGITKDDGTTVKYGLPDRDGLPGNDDFGWPWHEWRTSPVEAFQHLWVPLHGPQSWEENPEVCALTFTVEQQNIGEKVSA